MGMCACTTSVASEEERIIRHQEYTLQFDRVDFSECLSALKKSVVNGVLQLTSLKETLLQLDLPFTDKSAGTAIEAYYRGLVVNNEITLRMMVVTAVLLCDATTPQKINALYQAYDYNTNNEISVTEAGLMLEDFYQVACIDLPRLVNYKTAGGDFMTIHNYIAMISSVKHATLNKLNEALVGSSRSITNSEFCARMEVPPLCRMLTSTSYRVMFKEAFDCMSEVAKFKVLSRLK
jgi:hypothetical protein